MDINYLLLLQDFRLYTETYLAPIMDWITKMAVCPWPLVIMLMIYWVFDRKAGRRMLAGMGLGYLFNGFLKLTVCAYRPWIRDLRIEPYGDAKVAATGYSFPSGHSTAATIYYGSIGNWFRMNKKKIIAGIFFVMIFLTMFSRNYLGVHTPQDVIVGFGSTAVALVIGFYIEEWSDKDADKRDKIILVSGLLICVILAIYYFVKPYPMDYLSDGSLLVDPQKMIPDSFEGIGCVGAYSVCRYFERRGFSFDEELPWKDRFIIGTIAVLPIFWWSSHIVNIFASMGVKILGKTIWSAGIIVYATIVVPYIMKRVAQSKLLQVKQK